MKKIFIQFFILTILLGCSSDSSNSEDDLDLDYFMRFEIPNNFNYKESITIVSEYLNNDGSINYNFTAILKRVGSNPLFEQDVITFDIDFTLDNEIQVNQIIQIQNLNSIGGSFPYNNNNFSAPEFCALELESQPSSTGFVKITQITEDYIKGEFEFYNLKNSGGTNPLTSEPCPNYPNQQNYNIVNGSFKALR
jgi:hypothetical protein